MRRVSSCRRRQGECLGPRSVGDRTGEVTSGGEEGVSCLRERLSDASGAKGAASTARISPVFAGISSLSFSAALQTGCIKASTRRVRSGRAEGTRQAERGSREGMFVDGSARPPLGAPGGTRKCLVPVSCLVVDAGGRGRGRRGSLTIGRGGTEVMKTLSPSPSPLPLHPTSPTDHAVYREETIHRLSLSASIRRG